MAAIRYVTTATFNPVVSSVENGSNNTAGKKDAVNIAAITAEQLPSKNSRASRFNSLPERLVIKTLS